MDSSPLDIDALGRPCALNSTGALHSAYSLCMFLTGANVAADDIEYPSDEDIIDDDLNHVGEEFESSRSSSFEVDDDADYMNLDLL